MAMLVIGCDHAGVDLKDEIKQRCNEIYTGGMSVNIMDVGCFSNDSVDYPDITSKAVDAYRRAKETNEYVLGILICGTGIGMSISANKYKGIRAALIVDPHSAQMSRQHNDANFMCLGARMVTNKEMDWVKIFANTEFEGGRHKRRIEKIEEK